MTEHQIVDKFRETPGIEPPSTPGRRGPGERRRAPREQLRTIADVRAYVEATAKRQVENDPRVKAWQFAKRVSYLLGLVGAYLIYYLIDKIIVAMSLPHIGF